jgi:hypothetical protein
LKPAVPRSFRGEESGDYPEPGSIQRYKPPSVLAQHKGVGLLFGILAFALAVYFVKSLRAARPSPPPTQSVYIQVVPHNAPPKP